MQADEYAETLAQVAATVLEESAFVFTEPASGEVSWEGDMVQAQLEFSGGSRGSLMLAVTKGLATELAANMLGLDADDPDLEQGGDAAVCEILNVIAGPLMAAWFGEAAICQIGIPTSETVAASGHTGWKDVATCHVSLLTDENVPLELAAIVEGS